MEAAHNSIKMLITSWKSLRDAHPDQVNFSELGLKDLTAESFDETFALWEKLLEQLATSADPQSHIVEQRIIKILLDIRTEVDTNKSNNSDLKGLLQNVTFFQLMSEAATLISCASSKRSDFLSELIRLTKNNASKDFYLTRDAVSKAKKLLQQYEYVDKKAASFTKAETNAAASVGAIDTIKGNAEASQKDINDIHGNATKTKEELDKIAESLRAANKMSSETLDEIVQKKQSLEKEISGLDEVVLQAQSKVSTALQNLSKQGLAGSFTVQARTVGRERLMWLITFVVTIFALTTVTNWGNHFPFNSMPTKIATLQPQEAASKVSNRKSAQSLVVPSPLQRAEGDNNNDWWKAILQELPFAAPLIWLGWLSTRQIGILSKIRQDYNYKACTALAFEGYKKELSEANDLTLSKQLLETAIRNFGENPIRLYGGKDDHGMPVEELVSNIFDEKTLNKWLPQFSRICEVIGKYFGGGKA